jgi:hypothetical protein
MVVENGKKVTDAAAKTDKTAAQPEKKNPGDELVGVGRSSLIEHK